MKKIIPVMFLFAAYASAAQQAPRYSKAETIEWYRDLYQSSELDSMPWKSGKDKCSVGKLHPSVYEKATNRVNFFRVMNGLKEVTINTDFSRKAQAAAMLIYVNEELTHNPSKNMTCYSEDAALGCQKSCLGISDYKYYKTTAFITGFMQDLGDDNYYVGHRRWLLYSRLNEFGYGATSTTEALLTVDGVSYDEVEQPEFISYPWNGFVPVDLIFPKWSFAIPEAQDANFDDVQVTMTDANGKSIALNVLEEYKGFCDPTLVWTVSGMFTQEEIDFSKNSLAKNGYLNKKIKVEINGVTIAGVKKDFVYYVEPINADE